MDFFERQDKARRKTKLLVFYFAVAVALIIVTVYLAVLLIFAGTSLRHHRYYGEPAGVALWNPRLFLAAAVGTLAVIIIGSTTKTAQLAGGGSVVATTLGGRPVSTNTTDPDERKLLNVVEEMAIASGLPVPQVYLLDDETGINAFAAGHTPSDAAIGVTRGSVKLLSRDELQGVIGHEFSHILNGDMRLNMRLIGILFGILCLATIGRILLSARSRSSRGQNPLPLLGLVLLLVGSIGVLFGRLIQAAVSRQREFLADASSVQFTRNPAGLSGALQKIGGHGSRMESEHAPDASHLFFGNALGQSFFNAMATHPPLEERIRAIDSTWDGKFKQVAAEEAETLAPPVESRPRPTARPPIFGIPVPGILAAAGPTPPVIRSQTMLPNLGAPTALHLRYAEQLRNSFPESVQAAAREPLAAVALVYAMLLNSNPTERAAQLAELARRTTPTISEKVATLAPDVAGVAQHARLPLMNLALPALRSLRRPEYDEFAKTLQWLVEYDGQIDLFEYVLQKIIHRHLEPQFAEVRRAVIQYYSLKPLLPDCAVVLSALAHVGSDDLVEVEKAFQAGLPYLRTLDGGLPLLPTSECGIKQIDAALDRLAQAVPQIKKNVLEACARIVAADGIIQEREAELLRAIADTLDCPIPPFVQ